MLKCKNLKMVLAFCSLKLIFIDFNGWYCVIFSYLYTKINLEYFWYIGFLSLKLLQPVLSIANKTRKIRIYLYNEQMF